MSAWSGGRVLLLETNVEVQAHRPPLRKSSESESGPVLNEITGSDPVIRITAIATFWASLWMYPKNGFGTGSDPLCPRRTVNKAWQAYAAHVLDAIEKIRRIQQRGDITQDEVLYDRVRLHFSETAP